MLLCNMIEQIIILHTSENKKAKGTQKMFSNVVEYTLVESEINGRNYNVFQNKRILSLENPAPD